MTDAQQALAQVRKAIHGVVQPGIVVMTGEQASLILAHVEAQKAENEQLREMLAHLYAGSALYCDDGELQDARATPFIDFKRDSVADIRYAMVERNERKEQR